MSFILILIIISIKNLVGEKNKIFSALVVSQHNREIIFKTESVTEAMLMVEVSYKEYCTTFKKDAYDKYTGRVNKLTESLQALRTSVHESSTNEERVKRIFGEKNKEAEVYVKLRSLTDSLIFATANLNEQHFKLENYIEKISNIKVDTLSVVKTVETKKKGLLGRLKTFVVGENVKENTNTKVLVNTEEDLSKITPGISKTDELNKQIDYVSKKGAQNMPTLIRKALEMKKSELKLLEINNELIAEIGKIIDDIKSGIKRDEAYQNSAFLSSVSTSTNELQNILYILVVTAFVLVLYIIYLAYKADKFQRNIIALNEKITKDSIEKDKFYSILSHDLMNPFNIVLGFSNMLTESVRNNEKEEIAQYSEIIQNTTKQIFNLLQNLLTWSRVQNGKIEYQPNPVKVNELLDDSKMILTPIAQNKEIILSWDTSTEIEANLDRNMIGSVVQNLVTNAIKFSKRGDSIHIRSFVEDKMLNISVADSGVGMTEEQVNDLFRIDKSNSKKGTENENGTGLGLIICQEFVEKHGGNINVTSKPNEGTQFRVKIPLK
jgi:signal transduction histidine kinase